jgi:hypothetical protein
MACASAASFLPRLPLGRLGGELRADQPHGVAVPHEQPHPVVRTGRGFNANQFDQLVACDRRTLTQRDRLRLRSRRQNVLGEIDANGNNCHGLPLSE